MTNITPYSAAALQGSLVQQRAAAENQRQVRRLQNLERNSAPQGDRLDHQVESSDKSPDAGEDDGSGQGGYASAGGHGEPEEQKKPETAPGDDRPCIDIRA